MKKFLFISLFTICIISTKAQWVATSGSHPAYAISCMAIKGNEIFVGSNDGGVYLSSDSGSTWTAENSGLTYPLVTSLVIGTYMFAGTNGGGVFMSSNSGTNWTAANTGLANFHISSLALNGMNLFAGTNGGGIFLSTNSGVSWTPVNTGLTNLVIKSIAISGSNIFAATSGAGVFLSTNNGTSWVAVNSGLTNFNIKVLAANSYFVYAGTTTGIFITDNNGTHWDALSNGIPNYSTSSISTLGLNLFAGTLHGIYLSNDDRLNWAYANNNNLVTTLAFDQTHVYAIYDSSWVLRCPLNYFNIYPTNSFSGNVFYDANNNGIKDAGENGFPNAIIKTKYDNLYYYTDSSGNYTAYSTVPNDTIIIINPTPYSTVVPLKYYVNNNDTGKNFAVQLIPDIRNLKIIVSNLTSSARPGWNEQIRITYQNTGSDTMNGTVKLAFNNLLTFLSSNPTQSGINTDTISWNFTGLKPFEERNIDVLFNIPISVVPHTWLHFTGIIYPIVNDTFPNDNISFISKEVRTPEDPNRKEVIPSVGLTPLQVSNGDSLFYTIHFQNTGTDTAFYINILDTISSNLDISTLEILASSSYCKFNLIGSRVADFEFDDICLPDSSVNYYGSMGFVEYSVKPKSTLVAGDSITNKAYIYFDYNTPIATNTTNTIISETVNTPEILPSSNNMIVFPDPANIQISVLTNGIKQSVITIYNTQGDVIKKITTCKENTSINISDLANGVYFVEDINEKGVTIRKFIKL